MDIFKQCLYAALQEWSLSCLSTHRHVCTKSLLHSSHKPLDRPIGLQYNAYSLIYFHLPTLTYCQSTGYGYSIQWTAVGLVLVYNGLQNSSVVENLEGSWTSDICTLIAPGLQGHKIINLQSLEGYLPGGDTVNKEPWIRSVVSFTHRRFVPLFSERPSRHIDLAVRLFKILQAMQGICRGYAAELCSESGGQTDRGSVPGLFTVRDSARRVSSFGCAHHVSCPF